MSEVGLIEDTEVKLRLKDERNEVKQLKKELQVAVGAKNLAELTLRNSVMRQVELEVKVQKEREKSQQLQRELAEIKEEIVKVKEAHETLLKEKLALEVLQLKVQEKADQLQAEVVHWGIIAKCESSAKERVSFENMKLTYDLNETRVNLAKSEAKRTEVDRKMKKHMDRMEEMLKTQQERGDKLHAKLVESYEMAGKLCLKCAKISEEERPHCPICFEEFTQMKQTGKQLVSTKCGHLFCLEDLQMALSRIDRCPVCLTHITSVDYHTVFM